MLEPIGDGLRPAAEACFKKNPPEAMPRRIVVVAFALPAIGRGPRRRRAIKRMRRPPGGKPEADAGPIDRPCLPSSKTPGRGYIPVDRRASPPAPHRYPRWL